MQKKYIVRLSEQERDTLREVVKKLIDSELNPWLKKTGDPWVKS